MASVWRVRTWAGVPSEKTDPNAAATNSAWAFGDGGQQVADDVDPGTAATTSRRGTW